MRPDKRIVNTVDAVPKTDRQRGHTITRNIIALKEKLGSVFSVIETKHVPHQNVFASLTGSPCGLALHLFFYLSEKVQH